MNSPYLFLEELTPEKMKEVEKKLFEEPVLLPANGIDLVGFTNNLMDNIMTSLGFTYKKRKEFTKWMNRLSVAYLKAKNNDPEEAREILNQMEEFENQVVPYQYEFSPYSFESKGGDEIYLKLKLKEIRMLKIYIEKSLVNNIGTIANHYGNEPQHRQMAEECAELAQACLKAIRNGYNEESKDWIVEEIADVLIMISQIIVLDHLSDMDIRKVIREKVERQMVRIYQELNKEEEEVERQGD